MQLRPFDDGTIGDSLVTTIQRKIRQAGLMGLTMLGLLYHPHLESEAPPVLSPKVLAEYAEQRAVKEKQNALRVTATSAARTMGVTNKLELVELALRIATEERVNPWLFLALIYKESRYEELAISTQGALGYTQVMPYWHKSKIATLHKEIGHANFFDPEFSFRLGARIFREYRAETSSDCAALNRYSANANGYCDAVIKLSQRLQRADRNQSASSARLVVAVR